MVDAIANEPTGKADRPTADIKMTVTVLKKREVRKLESMQHVIYIHLLLHQLLQYVMV